MGKARRRAARRVLDQSTRSCRPASTSTPPAAGGSARPWSPPPGGASPSRHCPSRVTAVLVRGARAGYLELGDPAFGHTKKDRGVADRQLPRELPGEFAGLAGDWAWRSISLRLVRSSLDRASRPASPVRTDVKIKASFSAAREIFNQTNHRGHCGPARARSWPRYVCPAGQERRPSSHHRPPRGSYFFLNHPGRRRVRGPSIAARSGPDISGVLGDGSGATIGASVFAPDRRRWEPWRTGRTLRSMIRMTSRCHESRLQ